MSNGPSRWIIRLFVCGCLVAGPRALPAQAQVAWTWVSPLPQGNDLKKVVYGAGQYVAVGDLGTILTSPDGSAWTAQRSGTREELWDVTYGNGRFVAVGSAILTSPDGRRWTVRMSGLEIPLRGVAWGDGRFVAVGEQVLSSKDGRRWIAQKRPNRGGYLQAVLYAGGQFVAQGAGFLTSPDGRRWTARRGVRKNLYGLTYGGGRYIAVTPENSAGSCGAIVSSEDAARWVVQQAGSVRHSFDAQAVAYGKGRFVAVGSDGDVLISTDGRGWHPVALPGPLGSAPPLAAETRRALLCDPPEGRTGYRFNGIAFGGGRFVAVGEDGVTLTSADGESWTLRTAAKVLTSLLDVAFVDGRFYGLGSTGEIALSADGSAWTTQTPHPGLVLTGIAHGAGRTVIVGEGADGAVILTSSAGGWNTVTRGLSRCTALRAAAFGNGRFVALGDHDTILVSADAASWTAIPVVIGVGGGGGEPVDAMERAHGLSEQLRGVAFGDGRFVAVGDRGSILTSGDGEIWTPQPPRRFATFQQIAYGAGRFVAAGPNRTLWTSTDGLVWAEVTGIAWDPALPRGSDLLNGMFGITYGHGTFVGVGFGAIYTSPDGLTWTLQAANPEASLERVAYGNGRFVAVKGRTILTSPAAEP